MIEIQRILCPIDFSEHSRRALDHAVAIARWYGATITVINVVSPAPVTAYAPGPLVFEPMLLTSVDREQLLANMARFIDAEAAPGVVIDATIREGTAAGEILDAAVELDADLLVIGTHGRSGFERLVLGSVAEKVLRKAPCPVLAVPARQPDAVPAAPVVFKRILCPIDFSDSSMQALNYALSLAQEADGELTVLHVLPEPHQNTVSGTGDESALADILRRRESELRSQLEDAVPDSVRAYCRVETLTSHGKPWREILKEAAGRQAELIVMGVQGRGAVDLMFFGSTTQHVVREGRCPVLTIKVK